MCNLEIGKAFLKHSQKPSKKKIIIMYFTASKSYVSVDYDIPYTKLKDK